jgi:hypothetical protein
MSNRLTLMLAALIALLLALDLWLNAGGASLLLAQKGAGLVDYLTFWR